MIPRSVTPLVSVVIVTHGGGELLTKCIATLRANTREALEILVMDSASPDGTGEWARRALAGVQVHSSTANLGFGAMSNAGVRAARAPYVCFLNADVLVEPNWLPPLLEVLETQPTVGAVGPLLVNPDGSVQEFGSIVRADGWTQAWTSDSRFQRPVDYASGACLLVRRKTFLEVGGFAPEYHVAYFEDVDLAFTLRAAGFSTVVEPRSVVVHSRHGISGSERARELMERNHGIFAGKWAAELADHVDLDPRDPKPHHLAHARDLPALERILVIDDEIPDASLGIGDARTEQVLHALATPGRVVTFLTRMSSIADGRGLRARGIEVVTDVSDIFDWLSGRLGTYDVVIVSRPHNWEWAARAIDTFQPTAMRVYGGAPLSRTENEVEANAFTWADVAFCDTRANLDWVIEKISPPTHMHVVGYSAPAVEADSERAGVSFFGGDEAGALTLVNDIWPTLRDWHSSLKLTIIGADPSPRVAALAGPDISVIGRVPNVGWWLGRSRLHIAPVESHTLSPWLVASMAAGLPFLTTPTAAESLRLGDLARHLVSESPADLLKQADKLLNDQPLWRDVSDKLVDIAGEHFSTKAFHRSVDDVLLTCGIAPAER